MKTPNFVSQFSALDDASDVTEHLAFRADGTPFSPYYHDVYHPPAQSIGQFRHVFLGGTRAAERWRDRRHFTIVETGFGTGGNFLSTWLTWRLDARASQYLHFVSVEKHPFSRAALQQIHARQRVEGSPECRADRDRELERDNGSDIAALAVLSQYLHDAWPEALTPGLHKMSFDDARVTLTLCVGEALPIVRQLHLRAQAFFLDGFAPARNPAMWDPRLFAALARIADEDATLATYTSVGAVRRGLSDAGFAMSRAPGFGPKRDMLVGRFAPRWRIRRHPPPRAMTTVAAADRHAVVIGAGLAGCAMAAGLARRGWRISLIDSAAAAAQATSGNPAGVFHPVITRDDGLAARLSRTAFLHALREWTALEAAGYPLQWSKAGLIQQVEPGVERVHALPPSMVGRLDADKASQRVGHPLGAGGWCFERGGWMDPRSLCAAWLASASETLTTIFDTTIERVERAEQRWIVFDANGREAAAAADVVIFANALTAARLAGLEHAPTQPVRGQLTLMSRDAFPHLRAPLIGGAYLTPSPDGPLTGASYLVGETGLIPSEREDRENLDRLEALIHNGSGTHVLEKKNAGWQTTSRVGIRCVTSDRFPYIGPLADETEACGRAHTLRGAHLADIPRQSGLYGAFAYGSRGLLWSVLAADIVVSQIEGEPPPIESDLLAAVDPARFLLRALRRNQMSE